MHLVEQANPAREYAPHILLFTSVLENSNEVDFALANAAAESEIENREGEEKS